MGEEEEKLRRQILAQVKLYYDSCKEKREEFVPGKSRIPYSGRVYDEEEMQNAVSACLDFWLTSGRFCTQFESEFAKFMGAEFCSLTNSGSSANLLALSALTSPKLGGKRLKKGDKVITAAAGFPTTVNPIFQNGLIPKFVDSELGTYNPSPKMVEEAVDSDTKAIMFAHTLGNPFDAEKISQMAKESGLYLIEDCCDAVGSRLNGKPVGTFGDIATASFYPAHHITMGEGGAALTSNSQLKRIIDSFRDWGRDCWCPPGKDDTCAKRFSWQLGELPHGYDHKYIYSHRGYNLKVTDMQGAIGLAQLKKLPSFVEKRKQNYDFLISRISKVPGASSSFILPRAIEGADISPFGLPLTVAGGAPFSRKEIVEYLESRGIATRMLFGGNLTRQPAYVGERFEKSGELPNADRIMNDTFWIGVYPGMSGEMREYVASSFESFMKEKGAE
jgi:CDP-6-deoxy-D-xylo-4-hexulose-3-dehydrase